MLNSTVLIQYNICMNKSNLKIKVKYKLKFEDGYCIFYVNMLR